jgi:branched-chain amino acid aminotransferase
MTKVFLNDGLIDADDAKISVDDSGFLYGMGLFETMRTVKGKVFRLDDHLDRLFASAETLSIDCRHDRDYICGALDKTLKANELLDARIRLTISNGPTNPDQQPEPTLLISAVPFPAYPDLYYEKGVTVVLTNFRQNPHDPLAGHKTANYYSRLLALNAAHRKKSTEALWFTIDNRLAEGSVSNVFLVKDSVLYTPPLDTPVLPGIARKVICEIAKEQSIELVEKELFINDVTEADEIFLTNVVMGVMPVVAVEKHTVSEGKVGEITKKLIDCFNEKLV